MRYLKPSHLFRELLMAQNNGCARLIGLDVGATYVGVAVSDSTNKLAVPVSVIKRDRMSELENLAHAHSASGFVVGMPLGRDWTIPQGKIQFTVKDYIEGFSKGQLKNAGYTFWDESFTSKLAQMMLAPANLNRKQFKRGSDLQASVSILQAYLDYANAKGDEDEDSWSSDEDFENPESSLHCTE